MERTAQEKFIARAQKTITSMDHVKQHRLVGRYPFDCLWVRAPTPAMKGGRVALDDFHCRDLLIWLPEFQFENALPLGKPPCPKCNTARRVIANGWMQHGSRRVIMPNGTCDMTTFYYKCNGCEDFNSDLKEV